MTLSRKQKLAVTVVSVPLGLGLLSVLLAPFGFPVFFGLGNPSTGLIEQLRKIELPDYTVGEASTVVGGFGHPANDLAFSASKISSNSTIAAECKAVIAAAVKLGASSWYFDPDYVALPLADHAAQAQFACVQLLNAQSAASPDALQATGSPNFGLLARATDPGNRTDGSFVIEFNAAIDQRASVDDPKVYRYNLNVSTNSGSGDDRMQKRNWNDAWLAIPVSSRAIYELLDRLAGYRAANPEDALYAPASVAAALTGYTSDYPQATVTPIANQKGEVRWLQIEQQAAGGRLPVCMSIREYDPAFTGIADPGSGYILGVVSEFSAEMQFGQAVTGSCLAA